MTKSKAKNTRTLKTLKHIADNFGKEKRKSEKKEHLFDKIFAKKAEELVDEGESPMEDVMPEKEVEPAPEVTSNPLDVRPITKKFDGIKQNVVVFSGGFDSTLILVDLLEKGIKPRLLSFQCRQFGKNRHFTSEIAAQEKNPRISRQEVQLRAEP